MNFTFEPIGEANRAQAVRLTIKPNQQGFIETVAQCLQEADELPLWNPVGIYANEHLIGFAMYGLWPEESGARVMLDRFLLDEKYQGKGYSTPVLNALISRIAAQFGCDALYLSLYEDNTLAMAVYQKLGFVLTGEVDINGEKVMVLFLQDKAIGTP